MDIQFGRVPLGSDLGSTLKNISQQSSEVIGNSTLPPSPAVPQYSKDSPKRNIKPPQRYKKADLVAHALNVVEGIESSEEHSTEAISLIILLQGSFLSSFSNYGVICDLLLVVIIRAVLAPKIILLSIALILLIFKLPQLNFVEEVENLFDVFLEKLSFIHRSEIYLQVENL